MEEFNAKEMLGIDPFAKEYDLEAQYNLYRDLYFPPYFEMTVPRNESEIKRYMRKRIHSDAIEDYDFYISAEYTDLDKNNIDRSSVSAPPVSVLAFLKFGEVCDAYHTLKNDKSYPEYPLVMPDATDFDKANQSKVFGRIRKFLGGFVKLNLINLLLIFLFSTFIQIPGVLIALCCVHLAQWLCAWLYSPLDMLLVIPRRIWKGIKWGMNRYFVLLLPVLLVCAVACMVWGMIILVAFPAACVLDRNNKIEAGDEFKEHLKNLVDNRYTRICNQIEEFKNSYEHKNYRYVCDSRRYLEHLNPETLRTKLDYARSTVLEEHPFLANLLIQQNKRINELNETLINCANKSDRMQSLAEFSAKLGTVEYTTAEDLEYDSQSDFEMFNARNARKEAKALRELKYIETLLKITNHRIRMQITARWYEDCIVNRQR